MSFERAQPVLVFDSGVGGLSIFTALQKQMPAQPLAFASDNAFFPYGTKAEAELTERVLRVTRALIAALQPRLLVLACNTASTLALEVLRKNLTLPIIGVVPAIKTAAERSKSGVIALLATPATVARAYTQQLIDRFAAQCHVLKLGSSELVEMAEAKLRGQPVDEARIAQILSPLFAAGTQPPDCIVLGCTHFPLLAEELARAVPQPVQWLDSGSAIARRAVALLGDRSLGAAGDTSAPAPLCWMSAETPSARALWPALARLGFAGQRFINID